MRFRASPWANWRSLIPLIPLIISGRATKKEVNNKKSHVIVFHCTKNLCEPLFEQTELNRSKKKKIKIKKKQRIRRKYSNNLLHRVRGGKKIKKPPGQLRSRRINKSIKSDEITIATNLRCDDTTYSMSNQNVLSLCCRLASISI